MKIDITVFARDRVVVVFTPSLLDRLLGEKTEERVAVSFPTLPSGCRAWHYESNARPVPHRVSKLIEAAVTQREWRRILGT